MFIFAYKFKWINTIMKLEELELDDELEVNPEENLEEKEKDKAWIDYNNPENLNNLDIDDDNLDEDNPEENDEDDLITSILKSKGINPKAIKVENDNGDIEELDFNDLSKEEQLDILSYTPDNQDYSLESDEIEFLNVLRSNNLSVNDYLDFYKRQVIENYLDGIDQDVHFKVDDLSDDQLFIADLKDKIKDLTDEEALQQLELEKQNEVLFNKKINGIRASYQEKERLLAELEEKEQSEKEAAQAAAFEELIVKTIQDNDSIDLGGSSLTMSEDDMNDIASFILDSDATGTRYLAKALNDPKTLVDMAWFALKGKEAISKISEYYKKKISEVSKTNYERGLADARSGKPSVVVKTTTRKNNLKPLTINDLD